jgi:hypothetical protein
MSETKAVRIAGVKYTCEFKLRLRWVNGKTTSVDCLQLALHVYRDAVSATCEQVLLCTNDSDLAPRR